MKIKTKQIQVFLYKNNISHQWIGEPEQEYKIASIFNAEPKCFYYLAGNELPDITESSLILTQNVFDASHNCILKINEDPKKLFYKILNYYFKRVSTGVIAKTAVIDPEAEIGNNVQVDHYTVIGKCKIGNNCIIGSHSSIQDGSEIKANTIIDSHASIGTQGVAWVWNEEETNKIVQPQLGGVLIEENCFLGSNAIIVRGSLNENTCIGKNTLIAPGARVGHGTNIGSQVHFANNVITGGNSVIGDYSFVGSSAVFQPHIKVHSHTIVGAGAVVVKDTSAKGFTLIGVPAREVETKERPSGMPKPKKINTN